MNAKPKHIAASGFSQRIAIDPRSPDFLEQASAIAEALVIAESGDHWSMSARDLMRAIIAADDIRRGVRRSKRVRTSWR
jgi:hypothetical protein